MLDEVSSAQKSSWSECTSPYPLYTNKPGALITLVIFRGDNFSEWAIELAKQNIFIDGSIANQPWILINFSGSPQIPCSIGWIRALVDPIRQFSVAHVSDASKIWVFIKRRPPSTMVLTNIYLKMRSEIVNKTNKNSLILWTTMHTLGRIPKYQ